MKKIICIFCGVLLTQSACDLQPKVVSFPDTVGDFISARYPALLADPNTNPEIYNSAASDYGVYASPELYGTVSDDDYVVYASVDDYTMPSQNESVALYGQDIAVENTTADDYLQVPMYGGTDTVSSSPDEIIVARGDTLYGLAKKHNMSVDALAQANGLSAPYQLSVGQKLKLVAQKQTEKESVSDDILVVNKPTAVATKSPVRVDVKEITVVSGDTLYSLSRKYAVPVNDLAVMNNLKVPFVLSPGQKLRVPDLTDVPVAAAKKDTGVASAGIKKSGATAKTDKTVEDKAQKNKTEEKKTVAVPAKKISSDPSKKLPTISARSSSMFSWPVRGKILSAYGSKSNGLFNDGINIGAARGTAVKAAENGVVAYAGNEVKGMGNLVIVQHAGGWMTVYAHMDSMVVKRGSRVTVGQKIGVVGETGKVDKPQLHFEIRKGTKAYNPSTYLKK